MDFRNLKYLPMFLMLHLSLFACSPSFDKFVQVKKVMTRTEVIEIIDKPTKSEISMSIESLLHEIDTLNRCDLIGDDTKKSWRHPPTANPFWKNSMKNELGTWLEKCINGKI